MDIQEINKQKFLQTMEKTQRNSFAALKTKKRYQDPREYMQNQHNKLTRINNCTPDNDLYTIFGKSFTQKTIKKFETLMKQRFSQQEVKEYLEFLEIQGQRDYNDNMR